MSFVTPEDADADYLHEGRERDCNRQRQTCAGKR